MKWTQQHSSNAVAAKARKRLAEPPPEPRRYVPHPRGRAKWRLQLRDVEHGHSVTVRLYRTPWPGRWHNSAGNFSLDDLLRRIKRTINRVPVKQGFAPDGRPPQINRLARGIPQPPYAH